MQKEIVIGQDRIRTEKAQGMQGPFLRVCGEEGRFAEVTLFE